VQFVGFDTEVMHVGRPCVSRRLRVQMQPAFADPEEDVARPREGLVENDRNPKMFAPERDRRVDVGGQQVGVVEADHRGSASRAAEVR
jgi:hypothetical protein